MDDFGIGHVGRENADHLISALKMNYENITTDWEGKLYRGITMKWDHTKIYVDISMPVYVKEALHQFGHKIPKNPQCQPYPAPIRTYAADAKKMKPLDISPALPIEEVRKIEPIIGKLLYYARLVYSPCLFPISTMATRNDLTEQDEKTYTNF